MPLFTAVTYSFVYGCFVSLDLVIVLELSLSAVDIPARSLPPAQVPAREHRQDPCLPLSQCHITESFNCRFTFLMEPGSAPVHSLISLLRYGAVLQQSLASPLTSQSASTLQILIPLAAVSHSVFVP